MKVTGLLNMLRNRADRESLYSKAEFWDSKATSLSGGAVSMWPNNNLNRLYHSEQMKLVESVFSDVAGAKILDVGCGTGRLSRFLARRGAIVTGVDFSEKAIEIARRQSSDLNIDFIVDSIFNIDAQQEYDYICMWGCVTVAATSRADLTKILKNLSGALKPNGKFLLLEPIHKGPLHRVLNMNVDEFTEVMSASELNVTWVKQMHFWPARLGLAFIPWPNFFTWPLYHLGQAMMKLPLLNKLGDYKAILSSKV